MKEKIKSIISRTGQIFAARYKSLKKVSLPSISRYNPRIINYLLVTLSTIFLLYLMADLFVLSKRDQFLIDSVAVFEKGEENSAFVGEDEYTDEREMKPFSYYESVIRRRNIFKPTPAMAKERKAPPKRPIRLGELTENLSVSGIFLDKDPQAIIADRSGNKTWFVTEGQYINDILVKKIEKRKVTLAYKGEEMELFF
jgi:hypothetical protein